MKNKKIVKYTWNQVTNDCKKLAEQIKKSKIEIKNIYGSPRGGLIPAIILSHLLDLKVITRKDRITHNTLIIDDITDTGETLSKLFADTDLIYIAVLWKSNTSKYTPNFSINKYSSIKDWIQFPWETKDSSKKDN